MSAILVFACAVTTHLMGCKDNAEASVSGGSIVDSWADPKSENYATALPEKEYVKVSTWEVKTPFPNEHRITWDDEDADEEIKEVCPEARVQYDSQFHLLCGDCNNPDASAMLKGNMVVLLSEGGKGIELYTEHRNCIDLEGVEEHVKQISVGFTGLYWGSWGKKWGYVDPEAENYATKLSDQEYLIQGVWNISERFNEDAKWNDKTPHVITWEGGTECPQIKIQFEGGHPKGFKVYCVKEGEPDDENKLKGELVAITRHGGVRLPPLDDNWGKLYLDDDLVPYVRQVFVGITGYF